MAEAEGKNFSGRISKLPLTSLFNFLRLWDNTDSFIAQKWTACNFISRRFDEFSTCEILVFSWLIARTSEIFLFYYLCVCSQVFWLCFQTILLSYFHCCTAFEGPDLTTKPTVVVSRKLQPLKSKDCINSCFYLSKASICQTQCSYVTKGRPWQPHWGHDPSVPFAGLSQSTLSPMGQGWHPSGWDNRRGSPEGLCTLWVQGRNVLGCNKFRGCYEEESEVAKGRDRGGLGDNE